MSAKYSGLEQESDAPRASFRRKLDQFCGTWYSRVAIFCLLLLAFLLLAWAMFPRAASPSAEKQGAGLLLVADSKMLLLLRNSKHNDRTWGLPGGNKEEDDSDLFATAKREATEELGSLPDFDILTGILTKCASKLKRGKRQQKQYLVYVCNMTAPEVSEFEPNLNEEHHTYQWFDFSEASKLKNLHPVVSQLFHGPARKLLAAAVAAKPIKNEKGEKVEKRGAGLWLMEGINVLLLTKDSKNNNNTLTVPGGNVELQDADLFATAQRESEEEMGGYPGFELRGQVDTVRYGKETGGRKEFRLFLGSVTPEDGDPFVPRLSHESSNWGWYSLPELLMRSDLHPVVQIALQDHLFDIIAAYTFTPDEQAALNLAQENFASSKNVPDDQAIENWLDDGDQPTENHSG